MRWTILLLPLLCCSPESEFTPYIEVLDPALHLVLESEQQVEVLADGHEWTEGPLWVPELQALIYSDIPRNSVYILDEAGARIYLQPSGFTGEDFTGSEPGANGLLRDDEGNLVLCQHGDRRIVRMDAAVTNPAPQFETIIAHFEGKRLNSPNDAVFDSEGNLYFTDPPYGLPKRMDDPGKELDFQGVYRLTPEGQVTLLIDTLTRPNGLGLSPDEQTLIVANSDPQKAWWSTFDLDSAGRVTSGKRSFDGTSAVGKAPGLPDGLVVRSDGVIFASGPGGIWIFDKDMQQLGKIHTGQATSNCTLDDRETNLFITADMYVMKVSLKK